MKLLFDHNLSHTLVGCLADVYPGSEHVRDVGLHRADDSDVWEYARTTGEDRGVRLRRPRSEAATGVSRISLDTT